MLDEIFDLFERDRRSHGQKPRRGVRGLLARLVNDDREDRGPEHERRRDHDDDRHDRRAPRSGRRTCDGFDFDD